MTDEPPNDDSEDRSSASRPPRGLLQRLVTWLRGRNGDGSLRESLEEIFEYHEEGDRPVTREERLMLLNIVQFAELSAEDVMVPRADIVALDVTTTFEDVLALFTGGSHSRLPLYRSNLDDIVGMIHIKDILKALAEREAGKPSPQLLDIKRPVLFIPPSVPVPDLLLKMRTTRTHLALVVDEYGGTDGLVTIEDLVEEIVGEMEEHDSPDDEPKLEKGATGDYVADARLPVEDLEEELHMPLLDEDWEEEIDTVGGLVVALAGRVPGRGEVISHEAGIEFEVMDADPRRLKRLRIRRVPPVAVAANQ
jgi:CBS domain containing-hemolysin-like protein